MLKGAKQGAVWETEYLCFTGLSAFDKAGSHERVMPDYIKQDPLIM